MARYIGSKCKQCRREKTKLFLKTIRCTTDRCAFEKRGYAPGQHGLRRYKTSEYQLRLREKQKARKIYGILEKQFRRYYEMANKQSGATGENLIRLIERRLDNIVFRLGFASSRILARQLVNHGHFLVNGKRVTIPSFLVKMGSSIEVKEKSKKLSVILDSIERAKDKESVPEWVEANFDDLKGTLKRYPEKEDIGLVIQEQMIVEYYSR